MNRNTKYPHAIFFWCSIEKLLYKCISFYQFLSMSNLQLNQSRQIRDGKKYRKCGDVQWMCGSEGKVGRSRRNDGKNLADRKKWRTSRRKRRKVNNLKHSDMTQLPPSFIPPSSPPYEGCVGPGERREREVRGREEEREGKGTSKNSTVLLLSMHYEENTHSNTSFWTTDFSLFHL